MDDLTQVPIHHATQLWQVSDRTAHNWIKKARVRPIKDGADERRHTITKSQVQNIARQHGRPMPTDEAIAAIIHESREPVRAREVALSLKAALELSDEDMSRLLASSVRVAVDPQFQHIHKRLDDFERRQQEMFGSMENLYKRQSLMEKLADAIRVLVARAVGIPISTSWTSETVAEAMGLPTSDGRLREIMAPEAGDANDSSELPVPS